MIAASAEAPAGQGGCLAALAMVGRRNMRRGSGKRPGLPRLLPFGDGQLGNRHRTAEAGTDRHACGDTSMVSITANRCWPSASMVMAVGSYGDRRFMYRRPVYV